MLKKNIKKIILAAIILNISSGWFIGLDVKAADVSLYDTTRQEWVGEWIPV